MTGYGLTAAMVAELIDVELDKWPGQCFAISTLMVDKGLVPGGKAVYGHYNGPVAKDSIFAKRAIVRHGWIKVGDTVVDPTRYVFEGDGSPDKAYVHVGPAGPEYDQGGNAFLAKTMLPPPPFDQTQKTFTIKNEGFRLAVDMLIPGFSGTLSMGQAFWLGKLPADGSTIQPEVVRIVYAGLNGLGLKALVPLDNWQMIME